jgi:Mannosyltransferase (PIG-V)
MAVTTESTSNPRRVIARSATLARLSAVELAALALAATTRVALLLLVWMSLRIFPRWPLYPAQYPDTFFPNHPAIDGWARWDASHYVNLAQFGYGSDNPSPHGGLGFFPLYSMLMRGLVELFRVSPTPGHLAFAGIVIANVCFFLAVPLFARMATEQVGDAAARNAALLLLIVPFSFFFNAAYSESLFLLLSLLSLACARKNKWWWAAAFAGLASGTRLVGLALAPALLLLAWRRRASIRDLAAIAILSVSGLVAFFVYCAIAFDNLFAYFDAQATWGGWDDHVRFYAELFLRHPREALYGDPRHLIILTNLALAILFLAFVPMVWKQLDGATALFTTLLIVLQGAFTWVSLGRYILPAVGVYFVAGALLARPRWSGWPRDAVLVASTLLLGLLAVLYGHAFWVV